MDNIINNMLMTFIYKIDVWYAKRLTAEPMTKMGGMAGFRIYNVIHWFKIFRKSLPWWTKQSRKEDDWI